MRTGSAGTIFRRHMNQSMCLVKIHRLKNIGRNEPIILKRLGDAIDLYRQRDRNSRPLQFPGEGHHRRSAPTVSEQHDTS